MSLSMSSANRCSCSGQIRAPNRLSWDAPWRAQLVDNLEVLSRQLWQAGIRDIFADGSFAGRQGPPQRYRRVFRLHFGPAENRRAGTPAEPAGPVQGLDLGPSLSQSHIGDIRKNSYQCGTVTASNCIRTCRGSASAAAFVTNTGMSSNSPRRFASRGATVDRGAS